MPTSTLADSLYERLRQSFPADQAYTTDDWTADALPGPVRHHLIHLMRHHGRQEARRLRHARTEWVNHDHPDVEQAAGPFFDAVEAHAQVPADQWTETLRTATRRTTNHLVRPVPTLASFIFEEASGALPVAEIQWRMHFFGPYDYLPNAVEAFATKHDRDRLTPDTVEQVLQRVDERMTADFDAERWLQLLDPLFETAQRATGRGQVSIPLLRTFFEEKRAASIIDRLDAHERENGGEAVAPHTLRRLLETAQRADSSPPSEPSPSPGTDSTPQPAPTNSPLSADIQDVAPPSRPSAPEETSSEDPPNGPTPMWKQFEQDTVRRSSEVDAPEHGNAQPLWAQFQQGPASPSDSSPASSRPGPAASPSSPNDSAPSPDGEDLAALEEDVFGTAPAPKRSVYVQNLFHGDQAAYRQALDRLRTTDRWSEASQTIAREVFRANQINIYSDAAVHFTNAVEAGFKEA